MICWARAQGGFSEMVSWLKNFLSRPSLPAQSPLQQSLPPARKGFLSTQDTSPSNIDLVTRVALALKMSFQKPMETALFEVDPMTGAAMDSAGIVQVKAMNAGVGFLPIQQLEWYSGQGFIGWQTCAMLSQNWLISKACTVPARDAIRNGWELSVNKGEQLTPDQVGEIATLDKQYKIMHNLLEFVKNARVFGIRHALFVVDSPDPDYYFKPFNPDGVRKGSYRGISQIDPYWITPEFDANAAANPAAMDFYEPTWWRIGGVRVHRSHFVIMRGDELPDILKPSYFYGGISVPQKIYERVYAAERTANEAPLLARSKRLFTLKIDTATAMANGDQFKIEMEKWMNYLDNFSAKIIDHADEIAQFDTSLNDLDETTMTQYQLVAAGANMPVTKLLGTTPKGFNATGEYDEKSYHEDLESTQENDLTPFLERHYMLVARSDLGRKDTFNVTWNPTDVPTKKEEAEINEIEARTDASLSSAGALDGFDIRTRLAKNKESPYHGIPEIVPDGPGDRDKIKEDEENDNDEPADET